MKRYSMCVCFLFILLQQLLDSNASCPRALCHLSKLLLGWNRKAIYTNKFDTVLMGCVSSLMRMSVSFELNTIEAEDNTNQNYTLLLQTKCWKTVILGVRTQIKGISNNSIPLLACMKLCVSTCVYVQYLFGVCVFLQRSYPSVCLSV